MAVQEFTVSPQTITLGNTVDITASFVSLAKCQQKLVVDYAVHYVKKNGETSAKVFKWKEMNLQSEERTSLTIKRAIRNFTTRKHYPGRHRIDLIVNGQTVAETFFDLES